MCVCILKIVVDGQRIATSDYYSSVVWWEDVKKKKRTWALEANIHFS